MKSFKIYTENRDERWIKDLLKITFDGFTIWRTQGFWKGKEENALCIEIITDDKTLIKAVSQKIKSHNNQDVVLYTETQIKVNFVGE